MFIRIIVLFFLFCFNAALSCGTCYGDPNSSAVNGMNWAIISLLVTTGFFVGLFTYKMQFLQTVNFKQNLALKDLRKKYKGFTKAVVSLREELSSDDVNFSSTVFYLRKRKLIAQKKYRNDPI